MQKTRKYLLFILGVSLLLAFSLAGTATADSVYVIANINASPTPIQAYNLNADGTITYQTTHNVPSYAGGAVGLSAYVEIDPVTGDPTGKGTLFVTYEVSNVIQLVDANTMTSAGSTAAPGASNLAGIAYDEVKEKVYTVDRNTNNLYVYSFDPTTNTLTLDGGAATSLTGVGQAHGIALDTVNGLLYVGDRTKTVKIFSTADWSAAGNFLVSQDVMGITVDVANGFVYTGNAYPGYGSLGLLCKYDLNTGTETTLSISSITGVTDNVLGLAVNQQSGLLYITTGDQAWGGSDKLIVLNSDLAQVDSTADIGDPTGVFVFAGIGSRQLNLSKADDGVCVLSGGIVTYTICFDNTLNTFPVNNVTLTDYLPAETRFDSSSDGGVYDEVTHTVTWDIGTLDVGEGDCRTLNLQVDSGSSLGFTNYAEIISDETPVESDTDDTCVQPQQTCDVNNDDFIDIDDIREIGAHRGTTNPLYDIDGDGVVTTNDARQCVLDCDNPRCVPSP